MDKGKIVRLGLIPITVGLVITLIVRQMIGIGSAREAAPAPAEVVSVVVVSPKAAIPARTKLTEQHVVRKEILKSMLTGTEFTSVSDVIGQTTNVELQPGEVVLKARLVPPGEGTLPYRIPAGTRAMTIRIDEFSGVAGHVNEGDLVDLVLFLPAKDPLRPQAMSRLLYESIQVLGKGPVTADGKNAGADGKLTSVTLALKPQAAVDVTLAQELGHITLLLRPALKEPDVGTVILQEDHYLAPVKK